MHLDRYKILNEIREELTDLLSKRTTSIIVVMDDLDRLNEQGW
jgi:Cdc6-like AAA superfamily ATPase